MPYVAEYCAAKAPQFPAPSAVHFKEKATQRRLFLDELFPVCFSAAQALCTGMVRRYLRFNGLVY